MTKVRALLGWAPIIHLVRLLALAGLFFVAQPALAQTQEACPLAPGVTPPPDPAVTAQQVENGSGSLMDFALAAKSQFSQGTATLSEAFYIGCIIRQEGSAWRSGSTYLVQLTADSRIFVHAQNMALSGRLLNPLIYGAILRALGISPADLANPRTALAAFAAAAAGNGGAFNVPGIPGASGYVVTYISANFGAPVLMLAGFEINESHLIQEDIDYGDPTVTARDVVDRETLKAFVTQAGEFFREHQTSGDLAASSRARIALRDPNGPWRHGSVYLYVLDLTTNIVLFHGAFPDRFELRPLVGIARDGRTGELILPQVLAAAASSPEGGFVRYYYEDPGDDTDSPDVPKVGYAREFSGQINVAGRVLPLRFVVGSGFYLSSPEVVAARQNKIIETVLPQIMRTMTASTVDAISERIQQASSGASRTPAFSLGGASTLSDALMANGMALGNGMSDFNYLLAGSSFNLPLNANGSGNGALGNLTLWGNADYRNLSDDNLQVAAYDGDVVSANLGIDSQFGGNLLGGVSLTLARGTVDYTDPELVTGEFTTTLSSINPYVGWQLGESASLWAAAGYGWGEVEFEESTNSQASNMTQTMVAAGVNMSLMSSEELIAGGATSLKLKGETAFTRADVEGAGSIRATKLDASRSRLMFEGSHVRTLASDATLTPSIEVGMRYDGGDGETGGGLEVGAGLGYSSGRLAVKVNASTLVNHSQADEYEEWSVSGMVAYQPRSDGRGLSMTLGSSWGAAHSVAQSTWLRRDARAPAWGQPLANPAQRFRGTALAGPARRYQGGAPMNPEHGFPGAALMSPAQRVRAEVRYGLNAPNGLGLWSPYLGADTGGGYRALRLGLRLRSDTGLEAGLEVGRREGMYLPAHQAIELRGRMPW